MTNRLRTASLVVALACACDGDREETGTGTATATSVGTTVNASTTMDASAGEEDDEGDGESESGDPTADPTDDPTADPTTDPTADPTDDPTDASDTANGESSGGASGFTINGSASRAAAGNISDGDDGIGTLYIGALVACDQNAASVGATSVIGADMSQVGSPVLYSIEGLPSGTYYLAGFLDDDVNADPADPYADIGDIAFAEGFGIGCVEVVVAEADAVAGPMALNINVPF